MRLKYRGYNFFTEQVVHGAAYICSEQSYTTGRISKPFRSSVTKCLR